MFLDNKYTKWYYNIIAKAKSRDLDTSTIYTEKHHIIPKSIGGVDDIENIAILLPREHFICHLLLTKMCTGKARRNMWYASYMMCKGISRVPRYKPTARMYEMLRQNMIKANKERPGPNLGRIFTEEQRNNMSKATKGIPKGPFTEEHRQNMRKPKPEGFGQKVSEYRTGKSWGYHPTEETLQKMSAWQKDIPKPKHTCEYCGKKISLMYYKRWHGPNCKLSPTYVPPIKVTKICEYCNKELDVANYAQWHGNKCRKKPILLFLSNAEIRRECLLTLKPGHPLDFQILL